MISKTNLSMILALMLCQALTRTAAGQARGSDVIYLDSGVPRRGSIVEITRDEVTIDVRGSTQRIPVHQIRNLTFSEDPNELRRARDLVRQGQLETALSTLLQTDLARVDRDAVRTDIQWYTLYCQAKLALTRGNDLSKVAKDTLKFVSENRSSHHFYAAVELLGDLAMRLDNYTEAAKFYSALNRAQSPELKMRGEMLEANALRADGKYARAQEKYDAVIGASLATAEANRQKNLALVGKAACQAELGQAVEGVTAIETIIADNDPQDKELFAMAYNALGACYRQQNSPKEALRAYLHVELLFDQPGPAHAEALYYISSLWSQLDKTQRAMEARNTLRSRYPGSRWARR